MKKILLALLLIGNYAFAQNETVAIKTLGLNSEFAYKMLDQNQDFRKINILLEAKKNGSIKNNSLIIGSSMISLFDYQHSNTEAKFAYLMKHPTSNNQNGKNNTNAIIYSFQISLTATVNSWISTHAEILYNPSQSFGAGTISTISRNQLQLRKGFVLIGDLNAFPLYGALGKMDAPFGQMGSVNPFSNSSMWHAFGGLGYGAVIGLKKGGLHTKFMAVLGGDQFRALNTRVGNSNTPSKINNYVADLNYKINFSKDVNFLVGASYLRGSSYCHVFPVFHFGECSYNNPAYTYYTTLNINNRLILKGSFAKTIKVWEGTYNPTPPLDVFPATKVSSLDIGAKYDLNKSNKLKYTISGEFSNLIMGPHGAPWERQNQIILGFEALLNNSSKLFVELFRTDGYVPLNFISGSPDNAPFPPGVTPSVREANSMGIIVGAQISF